MVSTKDFALVYSSDSGIICPDCSKPIQKCECAGAAKAAVLGDGKVRVRRETQGRGGKTVSTVRGLAMNASQLKELLSELKRSCGSGGTVKDGVIEIQGDHVEKILELLSNKKLNPKRAGG